MKNDPCIIRFGPFEADLETGELHNAGAKLSLQVQPFQGLAFFLQHPGELVTREQLRSHIWPNDTFVDFDHALNTSIAKIRLALGDDAEHPKYIETLPRRGYRFIAAVEKPQTEAINTGPAIAVGRKTSVQWWRWALLGAVAATLLTLF